jgi:hypothetical protein
MNSGSNERLTFHKNTSQLQTSMLLFRRLSTCHVYRSSQYVLDPAVLGKTSLSRAGGYGIKQSPPARSTETCPRRDASVGLSLRLARPGSRTVCPVFPTSETCAYEIRHLKTAGDFASFDPSVGPGRLRHMVGSVPCFGQMRN